MLLTRGAPLLVGLGVISAVSAASYAGYRFVTTSEQFAIEEIELAGATASREEALSILAAARGANLFLTDLDALESSLGQVPWIATASITRDLPDRLEVSIVERQAKAVVELGELYLADEHGAPFKRVDLAAGDGAGLPLVTGFERATYADDPAAAHAAIVDAISAYERYSADAERPRIGEVHFDQRRGLTLFTFESGTAIRVGTYQPDELPARLAAFDSAWRALAEGERAHALTFHVDSAGRTDRVTVGFEQSE